MINLDNHQEALFFSSNQNEVKKIALEAKKRVFSGQVGFAACDEFLCRGLENDIPDA